MDLSIAYPLNSNGSGVLAGVVLADPSNVSGSAFSEWTSLQALFASVRVISLEVQFMRMINTLQETKGNDIYPFVIASQMSGTPSAPASLAAITDNGDAKMYNVLNDTSPAGTIKRIVWKPRPQFASTSTPVTTGSPNVGCPGGIQFYTQGLDLTIPVAHMLVRGRYEFKSRI